MVHKCTQDRGQFLNLSKKSLLIVSAVECSSMATYIIEPSSSGPAERLAEVLQDLGHRLVFIRPNEGDAIPADASDIDALVIMGCLLYTSPSPRDRQKSRMPSSA